MTANFPKKGGGIRLYRFIHWQFKNFFALIKKEEIVKRRIFGVLLSALFVFTMVSVSFAADQDFKKYGVRIRGLYVIVNEHFDGALPPGLVVDDAVAPELDLEYFFTKNISAELDLALVKNDIMADNGGVNVGSVWLLPPSLYIKYHPMPDNCNISPYVGVGMNVVMPFDEKLNVPGGMKIDTSVGWAAKLGADIPIHKNCYLNVDAMYYNTETKIRLPGVAGSTKFNLDLNPVIISTGFGVRF